MKAQKWNLKAILYIAEINGKTKLGIATDWKKQEEEFVQFHGDVTIQLIMRCDFEHYWQAELVEQIIKLKLKPHLIPGLHEWLRDDFPLQNAINCFNQISRLLEPKYDRYEYIHRKGNHRWAFYRRVYEDLKNSLQEN